MTTEILIAAIVALLIIGGFIMLLIKPAAQKPTTAEPHPYQKLPYLLTAAERSFYGALTLAVDGQLTVFAKVRVADLMTPKKDDNRSRWRSALNKITSKHVDFVLCDNQDLSVHCAIELNDSSHKKNARKTRDAFLQGAFASADVRLITVTAKRTYAVAELKALLADVLPPATDAQPAPTAPPTEAPTTAKQPEKAASDATNTASSATTCPKCQSALKRRVAKKGKQAGNAFLACSSYPQCRFIAPLKA